MNINDIVFVDTETTGLHPTIHEIWEVAAVNQGIEQVWQLPVDLGRADPKALEIGGYHARRLEHDDRTDPREFAKDFVAATRGKHLCGANVSFDAQRLDTLLRANGQCPDWHYHLIDIEAMMVGFLRGRASLSGVRYPAILDLPWSSRSLSDAVGVDRNEFEAHSALGDALWVKALWEQMN